MYKELKKFTVKGNFTFTQEDNLEAVCNASEALQTASKSPSCVNVKFPFTVNFSNSLYIFLIF